MKNSNLLTCVLRTVVTHVIAVIKEYKSDTKYTKPVSNCKKNYNNCRIVHYFCNNLVCEQCRVASLLAGQWRASVAWLRHRALWHVLRGSAPSWSAQHVLPVVFRRRRQVSWEPSDYITFHYIEVFLLWPK